VAGTLTSLGINGDKYEIQGGGGTDKADISAIGTNEPNTIASRAYAVGEHFYKNGKFCTCTQAIAQGAQFTLGTNYVEGTIADYIGIDRDYISYELLGSVESTQSGNAAYWSLTTNKQFKNYRAIGMRCGDDANQWWLNDSNLKLLKFIVDNIQQPPSIGDFRERIYFQEAFGGIIFRNTGDIIQVTLPFPSFVGKVGKLYGFK